MKFKHNGHEYRIVFRHDKPRDLSAHVGHRLAVVPNRDSKKLAIACDTCRIDFQTGLQLWPLGKKQRRSTHAMIQVKTSTGWITTHEASTKVNVKHGDVFNRCDGREAALENILGRCGDLKTADKSTFEFAAWVAFFSRKSYQLALMKQYGVIA